MYLLFWQTCFKNLQLPRYGDFILIITFSLVYISFILQKLQIVIGAMVIAQDLTVMQENIKEWVRTKPCLDVIQCI